MTDVMDDYLAAYSFTPHYVSPEELPSPLKEFYHNLSYSNYLAVVVPSSSESLLTNHRVDLWHLLELYCSYAEVRS